MASVNEILGTATLTPMIQRLRGGVPRTNLDQGFFTNTVRVEGDIGVFNHDNATRANARRTAFGGEARARALVGLSQTPTKLIHSFETQRHQPTTYLNLMALDSTERQNMGRQEIARQTQRFNDLFDNLRVSALCSALFLQHIYFDGEGNLLHSSSGAVVDIDMGVPAGNKAQLDVLGAGDIIAASWALATTDILGHLDALQAAASQLSGWPVVNAIYGKNIRKYILANTACISLMQSNGTLTQAMTGNQIPAGFGGVNRWVSGTHFGFTDIAGTRRTWCGDDQIVFYPEVSREWYELQQGTYPVQNSPMKVYGSAEEAASDMRIVEGKFQFASVSFNPPAIDQYAGDTFLPVFKNPNVIFSADVTP
jgi:hypothetical protein